MKLYESIVFSISNFKEKSWEEIVLILDALIRRINSKTFDVKVFYHKGNEILKLEDISLVEIQELKMEIWKHCDENKKSFSRAAISVKKYSLKDSTLTERVMLKSEIVIDDF